LPVSVTPNAEPTPPPPIHPNLRVPSLGVTGVSDVSMAKEAQPPTLPLAVAVGAGAIILECCCVTTGAVKFESASTAVRIMNSVHGIGLMKELSTSGWPRNAALK